MKDVEYSLILLLEGFDKVESVLSVIGRLDSNLGFEKFTSLLDDEVASSGTENSGSQFFSVLGEIEKGLSLPLTFEIR